MSQGRVNRILKTPTNYPRRTHNGSKNPDGSIETCKGTRRGAVRRVNPPGTGGVAKQLRRRAAREGRV